MGQLLWIQLFFFLQTVARFFLNQQEVVFPFLDLTLMDYKDLTDLNRLYMHLYLALIGSSRYRVDQSFGLAGKIIKNYPKNGEKYSPILFHCFNLTNWQNKMKVEAFDVDHKPPNWLQIEHRLITFMSPANFKRHIKRLSSPDHNQQSIRLNKLNIIIPSFQNPKKILKLSEVGYQQTDKNFTDIPPNFSVQELSVKRCHK